MSFECRIEPERGLSRCLWPASHLRFSIYSMLIRRQRRAKRPRHHLRKTYPIFLHAKDDWWTYLCVFPGLDSVFHYIEQVEMSKETFLRWTRWKFSDIWILAHKYPRTFGCWETFIFQRSWRLMISEALALKNTLPILLMLFCTEDVVRHSYDY